MGRLSRQQAARYLAYCNGQLGDPDLTDDRRAVLEAKARFYRRALVGHCTICGRELTDPGSVELGIGPDCAEKLDRGDAADRDHDRAVAHELSFR